MNEIEAEQAKKFFGRVWDDVFGYLRLYDYLKLQASPTLGSKYKVKSIDAFWVSILGDRFMGKDASGYLPLRDGDIINLKNVFLTEWAPKLPGQLWTLEGGTDVAEDQRRVEVHQRPRDKVSAVLDPLGKRRVLSAGFGTIRTRQGLGDEDNYMYMGLTDEENWSCDRGIPVIVSASVYKQYQAFAFSGAPFLKHVEGVLHLNQDIPLSKFIPATMGCSLSPETESALRVRPHLPKCYVHIVSTLSNSFTQNDSHPKATAWAMFRTRLEEEPLRYTYTAFDPGSQESLIQAVNHIEWYMGKFGGNECITDFDGQNPRLQATIPPIEDLMHRRRRSVKEWVQTCDKWTSKTLRQLK